METSQRPTQSSSTEPIQQLHSHQRFDSIDLMRGLAMIFMALDHVRDFFNHEALLFSPTDLGETTAALFFTRWITHFCAPIFFFLAGTGAFLSLMRGKTKGELARFLLTRGLWLVALELTFVLCLGWRFNFHYDYLFGYVIWALGWSMVVMAALVYLPPWAVAAFGIVLIAGHDALTNIQAGAFGNFEWLWIILHDPDDIAITSTLTLDVAYTLIPWVGVMAAGFGFGKLLQGDYYDRQPRLFFLGMSLTAAFIILRVLNIYGDPTPWSVQETPLFTVLSFLNVEKYPASLLFLLMTLGPVIFALAFLRDDMGGLSHPLVTVGRVPLFYYLLHLPLIHLIAVALASFKYEQIDWLFTGVPGWPGTAPYPEDYGFGLPVVYLIWIAVVVILYPACLWFAKLKQKNRSPWLSYL